MFRSVCTVTFVLIAILFEICILVAMVMGLWHSFIIYTSGEEMVNIEGAHQAGTMMKKCVVLSRPLSYLLSLSLSPLLVM